MKGEKENPLRIGGLEQDQVSPGLYPGLPLTPLPALGQRVNALGQHPASCRSAALFQLLAQDRLMRIGRLQSQDAQSAARCPLPPNTLPLLSRAGGYSLHNPGASLACNCWGSTEASFSAPRSRSCHSCLFCLGDGHLPIPGHPLCSIPPNQTPQIKFETDKGIFRSSLTCPLQFRVGHGGRVWSSLGGWVL